MHYRFHGPRRTGNTATGKWQRLAHSGVGTVLAESDGTWRIRVTHRRTGTSIRRDVYSVIIEGESSSHEEFLSGFASKNAAVEAARKRVTMLEAIRKRQESRRWVKGS